MEYMEYHEKKRLIKIIRNIIFIIFLGVNYHFYATSPSKAYKELDKYLRNKYGEEFVIGYMGRRKVNRREWYEAGIVYPKSYIGTVKENDIYYWGRGFAEIKGIGLDVGDNYGGVLLNESANEFYGKKLKELFGENILPVLNIRGEYKYTDFLKEYLRVEKTISGGIYIFGRIENDEDREWYRKQIFEFIKFMKQTGTFEDVSLGITIVDERILADNSLTYIRQLEKIKDVDTDFKILDEAFKNTSQESMDNKIANFSRSNIVDELNEYSGYLLSTRIVSPKRLLSNSYDRNIVNYYNKPQDIIFSEEDLELQLEDGILKETDEKGYYETEIKNNIRNGKSTLYNRKGVVIWTGTYVNNVLEGETKSYYNNGYPREEGTYKNGLLEGEYFYYSISEKLSAPKFISAKEIYEKGNLKNRKTYYSKNQIESNRDYKDGIIEERCYYSNGKLMSTSTYKDDKKIGIEKQYDEAGYLSAEIPYKDGKRQGIIKEYFRDGKIKAEKTFERDYQHGEEKQYYPNGQLKSTSTYKDDKKIGIEKQYDEAGYLSAEIPYKDGERQGIAKEYFRDGKIKTEKTFERDYQYGEEKQYYPNGQLASVTNYHSLLFLTKCKHGVEKIYNEKGILVEENYYQDGLLNGIIKKYNQDNGELEYKMFYEKGTLMNTVEIN